MRVIEKLRRTFPWLDSFFGQVICILTAGVVILQISNFAVVCSVQWFYTVQAETLRTDHLVSYWKLFDNLPTEERQELIKKLNTSNHDINTEESITLLNKEPDWNILDHTSERQISNFAEHFESAQLTVPKILIRRLNDDANILRIHFSGIEAAMQLSDGTWIGITMPRNVDDRLFVWPQRILLFIFALILLAITGYLLKRISKPVENLSKALTIFGQSPENAQAIDESGTSEIRALTHSFNLMREQIQSNFQERNRMISSMAHDIRTPLTKLQLRVERVQPEQLRLKLTETISALAQTVSQGLDFARSLSTNEPFARLDLISFLTSVAEDFRDVGHQVEFFVSPKAISGQVIIKARVLCLRRCIDNLITNACKYGQKANISLQITSNEAIISIDDEGPGIPEELLEKVFEPYFRLEASRNLSTGGVGLGLSIAKNMALLNNSILILKNRESGGLSAQLSFQYKNVEL